MRWTLIAFFPLIALVLVEPAVAADSHCPSVAEDGFESAVISIAGPTCVTSILSEGDEVELDIPVVLDGAAPNSVVELAVDGAPVRRVSLLDEPIPKLLLRIGSYEISARLVTNEVATAHFAKLQASIVAAGPAFWTPVRTSGERGTALVIKRVGGVLDREEYSASIGGLPLALHATAGNTLSGIVPVQLPASGVFPIVVDGFGDTGVDFTVSPTAEVENARSVLAEKMEFAVADLGVQSTDPTLGVEERAAASRLRVLLDDVRLDLPSMTEADVESIARIVQAHSLDLPVLTKAATCESAKAQYLVVQATVAAQVATIAAFAVFGGPQGLAVALYLTYDLKSSRTRDWVAAAQSAIIENCATDTTETIVAASAPAAQRKQLSAGRIGLPNGQVQMVDILVRRQPSRVLIEAIENSLRSGFDSLRAVLGGEGLRFEWPEPVARLEAGNPADYTLTKVGGTALSFNGYDAGNGSMAIIAASDVSPQNFSLKLTHKQSARMSFANAELTGSVPANCEMYEALVVGKWTVHFTQDDGSIDTSQMELFPGGGGAYYGQYWNQWAVGASSSYSGLEPGCILQEWGFWHYAFGGMLRSTMSPGSVDFIVYDSRGASEYIGDPTGLAIKFRYQKN